MENVNFPRPGADESADGSVIDGTPSVSPNLLQGDVPAIAESIWALARSAHMLGINAAIIASRTGSAAPEVRVLADEIKRMGSDLTVLAARLGSPRA